MKTYALVKKCDFEDVGMAEKADAKSDAEQWAVVDQWAKPNDASIAWRLDAPEDDFIRVEFASIW